MGKKIIINGADFSENKINTESTFSTLYAFMGENNELVEVPINQITSGKGAYIYVNTNNDVYTIGKTATYAVGALIENNNYKRFKLKTRTGSRQSSGITVGVLVFRDINENIIKAFAVLPPNKEGTSKYIDVEPKTNITLEDTIPEGTVDIRAGYCGNSGNTFELTLYKDF